MKDNLTVEKAYDLGKQNCKDIIACGLDISKTFIFSDFDFVGDEFYRNIVRMQKVTNVNQCRHIFGFKDTDSIGKVSQRHAAHTRTTHAPRQLSMRKYVYALRPSHPFDALTPLAAPTCDLRGPSSPHLIALETYAYAACSA